MIFGSDMWKWLKFVIGLIRLLKVIFGDDEDKKDNAENGIKLENES